MTVCRRPTQQNFMTPLEQLPSSSGRATTARFFLRLIGLLSLLEVVLLIAAQDAWSRTPRVLLALAELGTGLATLVAGISFLMWLHLSIQKAHALGRMRHWTPGWAVAVWFIPVLSLFKPYQVLAQLAESLQPRGRAPVGPWWAFFLGQSFFTVATQVAVASSARSFSFRPETPFLLPLLASFTAAVAAFLCVRVINAIEHGFEAVEVDSAAPLEPVVAPPAGPLLAALLAPLSALVVLAVALLALSGGVEEVARLWEAAQWGAYGVLLSFWAGVPLVGIGLYRSAQGRRGGMGLMFAGAGLPIVAGLGLMLLSLRQMTEVLGMVNPADVMTIYAAGASEALASPIIAALTAFALAGTAAVAFVLFGRSRQAERGALPWAIVAVCTSAVSVLGLLGGLQLEHGRQSFEAIANVAPNLRVAALAQSFGALASIELISSALLGALVVVLVGFSVWLFRSGALRGSGMIGVGVALAAAALMCFVPSVAFALISASAPSVDGPPRLFGLELVESDVAPVVALPMVFVGPDFLHVNGHDFDRRTSEGRGEAISRIKVTREQLEELARMTLDDRPDVLGVVLDARLTGKDLRETFDLIAAGGAGKVVLMVRTVSPEVRVPRALAPLVDVLKEDVYGGFAVEIRRSDQTAPSSVVLGAAASPPGVKIGTLADFERSGESDLALFFGDEVSGEALMHAVMEAHRRGVRVHLPIIDAEAANLADLVE